MPATVAGRQRLAPPGVGMPSASSAAAISRKLVPLLRSVTILSAISRGTWDGRPSVLPSALARAKPSLVRREIRRRSSWATAILMFAVNSVRVRRVD